MKINFKKILSTVGHPFAISWKWLRRTIFKIPATEAESALLSVAVVLCCFWVITVGTLVETRYIIEEKTKIIKEQAQTIETYKIKEKKVPVMVPGKVKIVPMTEKQLQQQMVQAQHEAAKLRREKEYYQELARKYSKPTPKGQNPDQRLKTEEQINDQFINDWGNMK